MVKVKMVENIMISVVIPVLNNIKYTNELFEDIENCIYKPSEVILIDNNSSDNYKSLVEKYNSLNIEYIKLPKNIGVNNAWNMGIQKSKNELVSILNNDIRINKFFFKKTLDAMENSSVGISYPTTVKSFDFKDIDKDIKVEETFSNGNQGWAFTIRKSMLEKYGYIPQELKVWSGDNYLFLMAQTSGMKELKILNNNVFHYGSQTTSKFSKEDYEKLDAERMAEKFRWKIAQFELKKKINLLKSGE